MFVSNFTGAQMEYAWSVILNSGVTVAEVSFLKNAVAGTAVASKALVLNASKVVEGVVKLSADTIKELTNEFIIRTTKPTPAPSVGSVYLYAKSDGLYVLNSADVETKVSLYSKTETLFANTLEVLVIHNFNNQFPELIIVDTTNNALPADIQYAHANYLYVRFNHLRSGIVIAKNL